MTAARRRQVEWAQLVRAAAGMLQQFGDALADDDEILGVLAGEGLAATFPALPSHIRETLRELLDDEAARGWRADRSYQQTFACNVDESAGLAGEQA